MCIIRDEAAYVPRVVEFPQVCTVQLECVCDLMIHANNISN